MRPLTDDLAPAERDVLAHIEEYGCHVTTVAADEHGPGYAFSTGLWHKFQQPEVVVVGLPHDVATQLINLVCDDAEDGVRYAEGDRTDNLLHGYFVTFRAVPRTHYPGWLGIALWAYQSDDFPVLQLVWPDKQGRFPWQEGVREGFLASQPLLASLPSEPTGGDDSPPVNP
jgi:hypothetical protein